MKHYCMLMKKQAREDNKEWLVEILTNFGEFAVQLWSLEAHIQLEGLEHFRTRRFQANAADLVAARGVGLDTNDPRLNGRPICMVVQPLIFAYRMAGDKELGKKKIWAKAVVWVSNKDEIL
jgi:hypothetical protein